MEAENFFLFTQLANSRRVVQIRTNWELGDSRRSNVRCKLKPCVGRRRSGQCTVSGASQKRCLDDQQLAHELIVRGVLTRRGVGLRADVSLTDRDANQAHHQHDERCWLGHRTRSGLRSCLGAAVGQGNYQVTGIGTAIAVEITGRPGRRRSSLTLRVSVGGAPPTSSARNIKKRERGTQQLAAFAIRVLVLAHLEHVDQITGSTAEL
jgi:hypothetical protein